jgi:hypothetical protein
MLASISAHLFASRNTWVMWTSHGLSNKFMIFFLSVHPRILPFFLS